MMHKYTNVASVKESSELLLFLGCLGNNVTCTCRNFVMDFFIAKLTQK